MGSLIVESGGVPPIPAPIEEFEEKPMIAATKRPIRESPAFSR